MQISMLNFTKYLFVLLIFMVINPVTLLASSGSDSGTVSFKKQSSKNHYISLSGGMGISYSNNNSLKNYIQYEIPGYPSLADNQKLSDFKSGLELFGGIEKQLSRNLSLKGEYSYFIKSNNVTAYPNYDFTYYSHQPGIVLYYLIPQEYSFIKIGVGAGYSLNHFTFRNFGSETNYNSTGFNLKIDAVINAQIGNSVSGYIGGFINNSFLGNLKESNNSELKARNGDSVNLNSFGIGLKLGLEFYIF